MLTGSEIRRKFLDFFKQKEHKEVHSSSLVPANDPTLLFTNAGMNQFKDVFLGLETRDYKRATTSQKCVRAGGKHNDLENVGFTNRHHTFFEMLGNFSFGDYFKKDAIAYAWELITSPQWYAIEKQKLYVTIFKGENGVPRDAEAYDLWSAQGVAKDRIFEFGAKDNFWQMGDTGPCGPCSEIHYDMGAIASDQGHTDCKFGCDCGRFVEIWNLVFMQFDRVRFLKQVNPSSGFEDHELAKQEFAETGFQLIPLPKPSIDTGMGLERVTAVIQGKISNYDTDLFTPLIKRAAELMGTSLEKELNKESHARSAASLRVIADHSRAATFLISDGLIPDNGMRGYTLRKIIRRAITHGRSLGQTKPFLHKMVFAVRDLMVGAYPELMESAERISKIIVAEETRFAHTLDIGLEGLKNAAQGMNLIHKSEFEAMKNSPGRTPAEWSRALHRRTLAFDGHVAFNFTSTHGIPRDFIEDFCRDNDFEFDDRGYDEALAKEQARARASWKGAAKKTANPIYSEFLDHLYFLDPRFKEHGGSVATFPSKGQSEFVGYQQTQAISCGVLAIIKDGQGAKELNPGDEGEIILDHTPFYAESGGQVGDRGWLYSDDHNTVVAEVKGCYSPIQGVRAHQVIAKQPIRVGDKVDAVVNAEIRESTMRNHTATHLLQAGLREVLGKHVKQAGSLVAPNHLRFDFSHFTSVADEELQDIEDLINKEVLRNEKVEVIENVPIDVAINEYKAMALFGEKYGDRVRVIKIGDFSTELCGGTHTNATGEIGLIKVLKEGSVSSGVRRIEAVTGEGSLQHFRKDHELESVVASLATHSDAASPAEALKLELDKKDSEIKRLTRELDQARMKSASSTVASVTDKIKDIQGVKVLTHRVDNLERAQMRTLVDQLRDKIGSGVVVLGSATNGNVSLIVGVTKDLTQKIQAGKVIGPVAQKVGGKGGGRPDLAEAGGKNPEALDAALAEVYNVVGTLLA
jgi:alanyl-tRNA synthetase